MKTLIVRVVTIAFLDHTMSNATEAGLILCQVTGILTASSKEHFVIKTWQIVDNKGENDHNEECFSILRSSIKEMFVFNKGRRILNYK